MAHTFGKQTKKDKKKAQLFANCAFKCLLKVDGGVLKYFLFQNIRIF